MLCCIRSLISTQTFQRALTAGNGQVCRDKECPFSGVTSSGRVSRKVPESDVWSMMVPLLMRTAVSVCVCVFQDEKVKQDVEAQEAELEEQRKQEVLEQQRRRLEEERQKAEAKIQKKLQMRQQEVELREKILKNVKVGNVGVYVCVSVWGYVCEWVWVFICVCGGVCVRACVCVLGGGGGGSKLEAVRVLNSFP